MRWPESRRTRVKRHIPDPEIEERIQDKWEFRIITELLDGTHPEKNPLKRLALFERHCRTFLRYVENTQRAYNWIGMLMVSAGEPVNHNLAWDDEEDDALVRAKANGATLENLAFEHGRTVQAVAARLSHLTGIPKSDYMSAFLIGKLEGQEVRGLFQGQVKKVTA